MNILLIGNFGAGNYGDEAILIAMLSGLLEHFPDAHFKIISSGKAVTEGFLKPFISVWDLKKVEFVKPLPCGIRSFARSWFSGERKKIIQEIASCDMGIYCGGGLFTDEESIFAIPMWAEYSFWLKKFGKPIYSFGLGIGPFRHALSQKIFSFAFKNVSQVGVRDQFSLDQAKNSLGIDAKIMNTGDTFFLFPKRFFDKKGDLKNKKPYIALSLRDCKFISRFSYKKIARSLDLIIQNFGYDIRFFSFQKHGSKDLHIWHKICEHMNSREHIFLENAEHGIQEVLDGLSQAVFVIGMRFHSILFSLRSRKPFLSLPYAKKSLSLLKDNIFDSMSIKFDDFIQPYKLSEKIKNFMATISVIQAKIDSQAHELESSAQSHFTEFIKIIKQ